MPNPLAPAELVTLPRVRAWLESLRPNKVAYSDGQRRPCCTIAKYLHAHGHPKAAVGVSGWSESADVLREANFVPSHLHAAPITRLICLLDDAVLSGQRSLTASAALRILAQVEAHQ